MRVEDFEAKKISDLASLILDKVPEASLGDPLFKTSGAIVTSPFKMAVAVDANKQVVGVITGSDIVTKVSRNDAIKPGEQTKSVVNPDVVKIEESASISELIMKLSTTKVRAVVVTDGGKYVGIIDRQKLANAARELLS